MAAREKKIKELLHPLVESLQEAMGQNLIAVVLFGSRARGKTTKAKRLGHICFGSFATFVTHEAVRLLAWSV